MILKVTQPTRYFLRKLSGLKKLSEHSVDAILKIQCILLRQKSTAVTLHQTKVIKYYNRIYDGRFKSRNFEGIEMVVFA